MLATGRRPATYYSRRDIVRLRPLTVSRCVTMWQPRPTVAWWSIMHELTSGERLFSSSISSCGWDQTSCDHTLPPTTTRYIQLVCVCMCVCVYKSLTWHIFHWRKPTEYHDIDIKKLSMKAYRVNIKQAH